jgi:hypothetical protein
MILGPVLLAVMLVRFTGPDGQRIEVNPDEVVSLRVPRSVEGHFAKGIQCLIFTGDGKMTGVVESCDEVSLKLSERK